MGGFIIRMDEGAARYLADEVRAARNRRRLTQAQLATCAGVGPKLVHNIENGGGLTVSVGKLMALATALDIPVASLLPAAVPA